jgi:hypothetical protein
MLHTDISDIVGKSGDRSSDSEWGTGSRSTLCATAEASKETLLKSLDGVWSDDCLFTLKQAVETYDFHQGQGLRSSKPNCSNVQSRGSHRVRKPSLRKKEKPNREKINFPLIPSLTLLAGVDPNPGHQ